MEKLYQIIKTIEMVDVIIEEYNIVQNFKLRLIYTLDNFKNLLYEYAQGQKKKKSHKGLFFSVSSSKI